MLPLYQVWSPEGQPLNPHIKVAGKPCDVLYAKDKVMEVLDTKSNRVTLKMDVSHTEHSHVIGKGGNNIKKVMHDTGCHIHFPDSNRNNTAEKSNQVSIAGQPHGVESARAQIRELLPLVFIFELPITGMLQPIPDASSPTIQHIQQTYSVMITFKQRPRVYSTTVLVRGTMNNCKAVKEATALLLDHFSAGIGATVPVSMTLEIPPQHHLVIVGRAGINIKQIMQRTGASIHFPDPNTVTQQRKGTVYITGSVDGVFLARQQLIGCLPLVLMFDMKEDHDIDHTRVSQLMEQLDVYLSIKPKPRQPSKSVIVKSVERNAVNMYEARRLLLNLERDDRLPQPPSTTNHDIHTNLGLPNLSLIQPSPMTMNTNLVVMNGLPSPNGDLSPVAHSPNQWITSPTVYKPVMFMPPRTLQSPYDFYTQTNNLSKDLNHNSSLIRVPSPSDKGASSTNSSSNSPTHSSPCNSPTELTPSHHLKDVDLQSFKPGNNLLEVSKNVSPSNSGSTADILRALSQSKSCMLLDNSNSPFHDSVQYSPLGSSLFGQLPNGTTNGLDRLTEPNMDADNPITDKRAPGAERPSLSSLLMGLNADPIDYEKKKMLASKAMQKKPDGESRIPTDFWSGLGFSKSMPDSAIREKLAKNNIRRYKAPSVITEANESTEIDRDPWRDPNNINTVLGELSCSTTSYLPGSNVLTTSVSKPPPGLTKPPPGLTKPAWMEKPETTDLSVLFAKLGLSKYTELFQQQEIDISTFLTMTDQDLRELGIATFGARRKMLLAIADLSKHPNVFTDPPTTAPNIFQDTGASSLLHRRHDIVSQSGRW